MADTTTTSSPSRLTERASTIFTRLADLNLRMSKLSDRLLGPPTQPGVSAQSGTGGGGGTPPTPSLAALHHRLGDELTSIEALMGQLEDSV